MRESLNNRTNKEEQLELLILLQTNTISETAIILGKTISSISYYRKRHNATSPDKINQAIYLLEQKIKSDNPEINYEMQDNCTHSSFCFRCNDCKMVVSEQNVEKIMEAIQKHLDNHPKKYLTSQTI